MKTVVTIWFACNQSNEKSGTYSGTAEARLHEADPKLVSQSVVIAQIPENHATVIPPFLSRTPVPNFDRGNRCLYWMSRSPGDCTDRQRFCTRMGNTPPGPRTTAPFSGGNRNGGSRIRGGRENRPKSPRRASCAVRRGGVLTEDEGAVRRRKNTGFSPRFRRDFAGFILKQE